MASNLELHLDEIRPRIRQDILTIRRHLMEEVLQQYFRGLEIVDFDGDVEKCRIPYKRDAGGQEEDFRRFGEYDPGDVFRFFVRVRNEELERFVEEELLVDDDLASAATPVRSSHR